MANYTVKKSFCWYQVINKTTGRIQSCWKSLVAANQVCRDLNRMRAI